MSHDMKPTQTGIAVALALIVISIFFIFPGLSPFGSLNPADQAIDTTNEQSTMPTDDASIVELKINDTVVGTGESAAAGDTVTVNYVGSLTNGQAFDASANHGSAGFTFTLGAGQVIRGWDEGIAGMKVGGKRQLVIPAAMAYGNRAVGTVIPANSALIFEVEMLNIKKAAQ